MRNCTELAMRPPADWLRVPRILGEKIRAQGVGGETYLLTQSRGARIGYPAFPLNLIYFVRNKWNLSGFIGLEN